jgi:thiamine pyrophosphate-dependent acetolactate synthase large subunit-like protein
MVVSVMGDGSFGFTCGELETIVRRNVPLKMIVFSNSVFGWIKASQKTGYEQRYFSVDFTAPSTPAWPRPLASRPGAWRTHPSWRPR